MVIINFIFISIKKVMIKIFYCFTSNVKSAFIDLLHDLLKKNFLKLLFHFAIYSYQIHEICISHLPYLLPHFLINNHFQINLFKLILFIFFFVEKLKLFVKFILFNKNNV